MTFLRYAFAAIFILFATVVIGVVVGDVDPVSDETQMELNRK